jgi:hypothetical protein
VVASSHSLSDTVGQRWGIGFLIPRSFFCGPGETDMDNCQSYFCVTGDSRWIGWVMVTSTNTNKNKYRPPQAGGDHRHVPRSPTGFRNF